jgi:hypothetical protein
MKWILILILSSGNGRATTTAEFDSFEACEKAAVWSTDSFYGARARCFPKK